MDEQDATNGDILCAFASAKVGAVEIVRLSISEGEGNSAMVIYAHNSKVTKITINSNLNMLATASEKGTIIRVFQFNLKDGSSKCLHEFRRGSNWATIHWLTFSPDSAYLATSSDTGTVHIFKLQPLMPESIRKHKKILKTALMKHCIPNYLFSQWSFAQACLPTKEKSIIVFGRNNNLFLVISSNGYYYKYGINHKNGGECVELERIQYYR